MAFGARPLPTVRPPGDDYDDLEINHSLGKETFILAAIPILVIALVGAMILLSNRESTSTKMYRVEVVSKEYVPADTVTRPRMFHEKTYQPLPIVTERVPAQCYLRVLKEDGSPYKVKVPCDDYWDIIRLGDVMVLPIPESKK